MPLLITHDEIKKLPAEPRQRFVALEEIVRQRYDEIANRAEQWQVVQDARVQYMSEVIGAARYLKISPLSDMDLPKRSEYDDNSYEDFRAEVTYYTMQLALEGVDNDSALSIELVGPVKSRLITLAQHLREHVARLDVPPERIDRLVRHVAAFERDLESPRLTFVSVAVLTLTIASGIADLEGAASGVRQLINQVEEVVGRVHEEQATSRYLVEAPTEPRRIEPPRTAKPKVQRPDDDIPF